MRDGLAARNWTQGRDCSLRLGSMRARGLIRRWIAMLGLFGLVSLFGLFTGPSAHATNTESPTLLVVGDSLSAEYGLARGSGWVALLDERIRQEGRVLNVVNASISGDTTSGGRSRLPALLQQHRPRIVLIELGGNDALRGLPLSSTRDNLQTMIQQTQAAGAKALLIGMEVPPNYGARYTADFRRLFQEVAKERKVPLVPFFLAGIADGPDAASWFQPDGIHPLAKAHPRMLANIWPVLKPLLPAPAKPSGQPRR